MEDNLKRFKIAFSLMVGFVLGGLSVYYWHILLD